MSRLRDTTRAAPGKKAPDLFDTYYMVRDAVRRRERLIYGRLDDRYGEHCAIGCFFADNPNLALDSDLVDEIAAYNDSIPKHVSSRTRRNKVLAWLNAKIRYLQGITT